MLDPEATAAVIEKTESFMNPATSEGDASEDSDQDNDGSSGDKHNQSMGDIRSLRA